MQLLAIALGALAFRIVSTFVGSLSTAAYPSSLSDGADTTFGIYPVLTRIVDRLSERWLAGAVTPALIVSWLAFAGAMVLLLRLAQLDLDAERSEAAVLLAAVFPFAFIFGRPGAESLFLLFAVGAFYGFRRQMWIAGGVCGAAAAVTIPTGILILPALAWIGVRDGSGRRSMMFAALLLTAAGFAAYLSYLYYLGGPPGGWIISINEWGYHVGQLPWQALRQLIAAHSSPIEAMNAVVTLIAIAAIPLVWWRLNGGYAIYMIVMLSLPLVSGRYQPLGRACALLFPMFVLAASIRWRVIVMLIAVTSAMFYALAVPSL
jgi:Gpi18-like mannosyltransferase